LKKDADNFYFYFFVGDCVQVHVQKLPTLSHQGKLYTECYSGFSLVTKRTPLSVIVGLV
jgi:hypothetical protein